MDLCQAWTSVVQAEDIDRHLAEIVARLELASGATSSCPARGRGSSSITPPASFTAPHWLFSDLNPASSLVRRSSLAVRRRLQALLALWHFGHYWHYWHSGTLALPYLRLQLRLG